MQLAVAGLVAFTADFMQAREEGASLSKYFKPVTSFSRTSSRRLPAMPEIMRAYRRRATLPSRGAKEYTNAVPNRIGSELFSESIACWIVTFLPKNSSDWAFAK